MPAHLKTALVCCAMALATGSQAAAQTASPPRHAIPGWASDMANSAVSPLQHVFDIARAKGPALPKANAQAQPATMATPFGITVDAAGNLYVANLLAGVTVYNVKHLYQGQITTGLSNPSAVALNFAGDIFVANNGSGTISEFDPAWQPLHTISDPALALPAGKYIDQDDTIWVLDGSGGLHVYLDNFTVLPAVKLGGTAIGPWGPYNTVWGVANASGGFDEFGQNRDEGIRNNPGASFYYPSGSPAAGGVAQDSTGQQYVTDYVHNQVQIWDKTGSFRVGLINTPGAPYGVAVDSAHKKIYVSLTSLNEVVIYSSVAPYLQIGVIH